MPDVACTAEVITPRGRGAVATIRFCGDCRRLDGEGLFRAANGQPVPRQPTDRIVFGLWGRTATEQVVLCRTAEDVVEIHCHGGEAAVRRILADLAAAGCETRAWEPATAETDLLAAECKAALIGAATLQTAAIALDQQSGALAAAFEDLRLGDFDESARNEAAARIAGLLQWAGVGLHLTRPWNVVLAGRPNVGKSSLINALVGYARAVVHDRPGTTRDVVTAETALAGWPVQFADTAGIRHEAEPIEAAGIGMARERFATADCRILVIDRSEPPHNDDRQLLADWPAAIVVANKCDLPDAWGDAVPDGALIVSAHANSGINELAAAIIERLVPASPPPGTPVPVSSRQVDLLASAQSALEDNDQTAYQRAIDALLV